MKQALRALLGDLNETFTIGHDDRSRLLRASSRWSVVAVCGELELFARGQDVTIPTYYP